MATDPYTLLLLFESLDRRWSRSRLRLVHLQRILGENPEFRLWFDSPQFSPQQLRLQVPRHLLEELHRLGPQ